MNHDWCGIAVHDEQSESVGSGSGHVTPDGKIEIHFQDSNEIERRMMADIFGIDPRRIIFFREDEGGGGGYAIMGETWPEEVEAGMREHGVLGLGLQDGA